MFIGEKNVFHQTWGSFRSIFGLLSSLFTFSLHSQDFFNHFSFYL